MTPDFACENLRDDWLSSVEAFSNLTLQKFPFERSDLSYIMLSQFRHAVARALIARAMLDLVGFVIFASAPAQMRRVNASSMATAMSGFVHTRWSIAVHSPAHNAVRILMLSS
jgi:hypothetical protein